MFGRRKNEGGIPGISDGPSASNRPSIGGDPPTATIELPGHRERRRLWPWSIGLVAIVALGGIAGLTFFVFTQAEQRLTDELERAGRGAVTITSANSLIAGDNLRRALAAAERESPASATVESLRITPARIDLTVAGRDGAQRSLSIDPAFEVTSRSTIASKPDGLPFSRIPVAVPERLVRTIQGKLGLQPAALDYLLLSPRRDFAGKRDDAWGAYYSRPPLNNDATSTLQGKDVRLLGTPNAKTRATMQQSARLQP